MDSELLRPTEKAILAGFGGQGIMLMGQPVSYTHLDVYKRQAPPRQASR